MDIKQLNEISSGLRNTFQRAGEAFKKNNLGYALELYKTIVQKEPGFQAARDALRDVERALTEKMSGFAKLGSSFKNKFQMPKVKSMIKKDPLKAMAMAEDLLAKNLSDPSALNLLADAALAAGADIIAVEAYCILKEYAPKNEANLRNLAAVYRKNGEGTKVLQIFQQIAQMHPNNLQVEQEVRDAAALASMEKGHWTESNDFRDMLKNKDEAVSLEKEDRIARSEDDMALMIEQYEKAIAAGENTVDNFRKLADYYHRSNRFDDAVATYQKIIEKMGHLDPLIDSKIERVILDRYEKQIDGLKAQGGDISELETEKYNYRMERAVERVNNYPNDSVLRFNLGIVYWDGSFIDEALEQFQIGQRAPKFRQTATVYMGRCFHRKGQFDLAVEQFEKAIAEMKVMDKAKKEALYYLGVTYMDMGNKEKAGVYFKEIYQADINFMDIKARIKEIYG